MSNLPKIKYPLFDETIPSTKEAIKFRPFLVKEEKILLIAQSGGSRKDLVNGLKQVVNNCVVQTQKYKFDINALTTFDLEYLFLKIRAKSVDNVVKLKYIDHEDEKEYAFEINLDEIIMHTNPDHTNKIKINDELGIIMCYPNAELVAKFDEGLSDIEISNLMIANCIEKIYDAEDVYLVKEYSKEELDEFIDSMPSEAYRNIQTFFETMPKLYHKISPTEENV